jgi:hypothetical protein
MKSHASSTLPSYGQDATIPMKTKAYARCGKIKGQILPPLKRIRIGLPKKVGWLSEISTLSAGSVGLLCQTRLAYVVGEVLRFCESSGSCSSASSCGYIASCAVSEKH